MFFLQRTARQSFREAAAVVRLRNAMKCLQAPFILLRKAVSSKLKICARSLLFLFGNEGTRLCKTSADFYRLGNAMESSLKSTVGMLCRVREGLVDNLMGTQPRTAIARGLREGIGVETLRGIQKWVEEEGLLRRFWGLRAEIVAEKRLLKHGGVMLLRLWSNDKPGAFVVILFGKEMEATTFGSLAMATCEALLGNSSYGAQIHGGVIVSEHVVEKLQPASCSGRP